MSEQCRDIRDLLVAASFHDLERGQRRIVDLHVEECEACRTFRDGIITDDRELDAFVAATASRLPALEERIRAGVEKTAVGPVRRRIPPPILRWAAAATVVLAVVLGFGLVDRGGGPGLVWADVLARVADAQDFICRRIEKEDGEPALEMVEYRSGRYGLRQEIYRDGRHQASQYIIPGEHMLYALVHRDRTWMRQGMTEEQIAELKRQTNAREIVGSFRDQDFESLGRKEIDGRMAAGIEITDPPEWRTIYEGGVWRLWVDLETQWPVRIELEGTALEGRLHKTYTLKDFKWNPELTAKDFEVTIPGDYKLIADIPAVEATEEQTLAALRDYARLVGGRYPSRLSLATVIAEATEVLDEKHDGYDEAAGRDLKSLFTMRGACEFYESLESDYKDPAWYGDSVRATDFDRVLLRWRLEDGDYRVVYGDLRAETVDAARLVELESR